MGQNREGLTDSTTVGKYLFAKTTKGVQCYHLISIIEVLYKRPLERALKLGDLEFTTNLCFNFPYLYWEGCGFAVYICGNFWVTQYIFTEDFAPKEKPGSGFSPVMFASYAQSAYVVFSVITLKRKVYT